MRKAIRAAAERAYQLRALQKSSFWGRLGPGIEGRGKWQFAQTLWAKRLWDTEARAIKSVNLSTVQRIETRSEVHTF